MGVEPFSLSHRLAAGEEAAFAELYDRFGVRLYRTARRLLGDAHAAEDAVQEVFASVARNAAGAAQVLDWTAYLFSSLRHAAARLGGRLKKRPAPLIEEPAVPMLPGPDVGTQAALEKALAALPAEQREVLALKFEGGLTFEQIALQIGVGANTAASRYRYALEKLRGLMEVER